MILMQTKKQTELSEEDMFQIMIEKYSKALRMLQDEGKLEKQIVKKDEYALAAECVEKNIPINKTYDGKCHRCWERTKLTDQFCPKCGQRQPDLTKWMNENL